MSKIICNIHDTKYQLSGFINQDRFRKKNQEENHPGISVNKMT